MSIGLLKNYSNKNFICFYQIILTKIFKYFILRLSIYYYHRGSGQIQTSLIIPVLL